MRKLELVKAFEMEKENPHLAAYKKMFPQARPSIFQMDLIEAWVKDERAWQQTLEFWAGNDYRAQSIQKMIDYYKQIQNGTVQRFEDKTKVQMRVGQNEEPEPSYKCGVCFDLGWINGTWPNAEQPCPNGCERRAA